MSRSGCRPTAAWIEKMLNSTPARNLGWLQILKQAGRHCKSKVTFAIIVDSGHELHELVSPRIKMARFSFLSRRRGFQRALSSLSGTDVIDDSMSGPSVVHFSFYLYCENWSIIAARSFLL